ncbi:MAG TPA: hypothetical protein VFH45_02250 [Acidimicrobiales bacterium]|nr:hypothetical protein [Acidimicrobiales bacterium]
MRTPEMGRAMPGPPAAPGSGGRPGAGSIHDDTVAQRLGFRGGTIAGSIHMDQYPPLLVDAFGQEWFETGSLSLGFRNATISGEPVVAMVAAPGRRTDVQVEARTERTDGTLVASGTASVGRPDQPSHLHSIDLRAGDPAALRILKGVEPGLRLAHLARIESGPIRERVQRGGLPDPLGWHSGPSPWGGPIAHPSALVQLLRNRGSDFGPHTLEAVGLFGAIEVRHLAGPVLVDHEYRVEGEVVAVGASPRTEYVWYDTRALDDAGRPVASMRMQLRWMTASSPLYAGS